MVTGGAGFIGSHLCEKLLDLGNEVICVDNFYTGRKSNIVHLLNNSYFEVIRHDMIFPLYIEVDEIYNLACPASPVSYQLDPVKTIKTCLYGAINVLELAMKMKAKVLQASTSEIYGDPKITPQPENYWGNVNPIGPRSCYDEGKRCAETLFVDYNRQYDVKIKIGRIFNTYGPNMAINDGRVITNFITKALKNDSLEIYGDGKQTRSFCYVDDTINALIKMMNADDSVLGPINIGNDKEEISIKKLANKIIDIVGSSSNIEYKNKIKDDPRSRKPDISLMKGVLHYEPRVTLSEGILKTVEYLRPIVVGCENP